MTILLLDGFGIAWDGVPILADLDLRIERPGVVVLVGPAGSGKSTLLRTLAGLNQAQPALSTWGRAELAGQPLFGAHERGVGLVMQQSRFYMSTVRENLVSALPNRARLERAAQTRVACDLLRDAGLPELVGLLDAEVVTLPKPLQRMLAIVRATAHDPLLLLADEPTSGLDDDEAIDVVALLRGQAAFRSVVFATHNQRHGLAAGGETCLIAGGRLVDRAATGRFFREPETDHSRRFVATGTSSLPSPGAHAEDLDEHSPKPPPLSSGARKASEKKRRGPRGFFWIVPGRLAGLPRPGIIASLEKDLDGLQELGVTVLVTLEEQATVPIESLRARGIASIHLPIPDMGAPFVDEAAELAANVHALLEVGQVVAFHCRAGLGRTGTLLAAQLIWMGEPAVRAIERVRESNPWTIQSDGQLAFLGNFEAAIHPTPLAVPPTRKRETNVT